MMSEYLRVATVQVVQAVDLAELDKTIKWLVSKVQELPTADQANQRTVADSLLQDQIDALRRENSSLKDAVAQLQSKQDDMATRLDTKQDRNQEVPDEPEGSPDTPTISDLERRLVAVEQRMEQSPAEAPEPDPAPEAAGPDLNSQFQDLLAGHRALAATVSGLQHELESKPNRGELDLKANRSELDALLRSGVGLNTVGDSAPPPLAVASDGTLDNEALVEALNAAMGEMASMRGQVAVMHDRLQSKAEQGSLEDMVSQLAALKARQIPSERSTNEGQEAPQGASMADVEALSTSLNEVAKRLEDLELRAVSAAARPVSAPETEIRNRAVDAASSVMDIQPLLKDIYAQMESKADIPMMDDLLRRLGDLKAAVESKADATTLHNATQRLERQISGVRSKVRTPSAGKVVEPQWTISHELSPEYLNSSMEDLRSQVASLAKRMSFARPSTAELDGADLANIQAALAALQGQLGELITRLAGKADAGEVARLELALNSKADLDEVAEIRLALGAKADAAALSDLQMAVARKADQVALEEVKMAAALAADMASAGTNTDSSSGSSSGGYGNLLGAIQGMVADKASKAELSVLQNLVGGKASADDVALLRAAIDDKASAAELSALLAQFSGRAANSEEIASLDQRMGDVFAELAKIRANMAAMPSGDALVNGPPLSGRDGDQAGLQRMLSVLSREVGTLREGLDTVAHAANVLAVGLDGGVRMSVNGAPTGGLDGRYAEAEGVAGKENRSPRGGYERLVKLLGSGDYRHKMDAFDPTALQQMAQKLAYLEATFKSPAMGRVNGVDYGIKELERQVKRLGTDVRLMKDKLMDPGLMSPGRLPPGDHAMLASRPITGYRCMACDRPLDQLDALPGPHVPTQQLPVRVPAASDTASRQVRSGRGDQLSPQASGQKLIYNSDPTVRSVQNWYKDQQGMAAETLPREHVGPHLPPGGWRPSNPGSGTKIPIPQGALPALSKQNRSSPTPFEYEQKAQQSTGPQMEGAAANVTLPQIS